MQPTPSSDLSAPRPPVFPFSGVARAPARRMVTLDRQTFLALRNVLRAATKDCLRETFGVSETTWVKLRDGQPVKQVTLDRLMIRYRKILDAAAA